MCKRTTPPGAERERSRIKRAFNFNTRAKAAATVALTDFAQHIDPRIINPSCERGEHLPFPSPSGRGPTQVLVRGVREGLAATLKSLNFPSFPSYYAFTFFVFRRTM